MSGRNLPVSTGRNLPLLTATACLYHSTYYVRTRKRAYARRSHAYKIQNAIPLDTGGMLCDYYLMMTMTETLRRAIEESGISELKLSQITGVQRASIGRFRSGTQSIRLDCADKLAEYFGFELRPIRRPKGKR